MAFPRDVLACHASRPAFPVFLPAASLYAHAHPKNCDYNMLMSFAALKYIDELVKAAQKQRNEREGGSNMEYRRETKYEKAMSIWNADIRKHRGYNLPRREYGSMSVLVMLRVHKSDCTCDECP